MSVSEVYKEIEKDRHYYDFSGGGVTFSGGECLLQPEFLESILQKCKCSGIHIAIETAFNVDFPCISKIIPLVDTLFVDIKHMNAQMHKKFAGVSNERILSNIRQAANLHHNIIVRVPLIPSVNDNDENLYLTAEFVANCGIGKLELLKYNNLGASKYVQLGATPPSFSCVPQSNDEMESKTAFLSRSFGRDLSIFWS